MKWKLNVNVASLLLRVVVVYFIYYYGCMLIVNKWWNSREMQHNNFPFFIEWYNWVYWCGVRRAVVEARCHFLNLGSLMCRRLIPPPINLYLRPSLSRSRQLFQLSRLLYRVVNHHRFPPPFILLSNFVLHPSLPQENQLLVRGRVPAQIQQIFRVKQDDEQAVARRLHSVPAALMKAVCSV